jgi:hypothetical protein
MLIRKLGNDTIEFTKIEPPELDLLKKILSAGDPAGNAAAESRLYPSPADPAETELIQDWTELVQPEIERGFAESRELVRGDLATAKPESGRLSRLTFPANHVESWLVVLNQARLVLVEVHNFTERELTAHLLPLSFTRRQLVLIQINFYAAIQERLIELVWEG